MDRGTQIPVLQLLHIISLSLSPDLEILEGFSGSIHRDVDRSRLPRNPRCLRLPRMELLWCVDGAGVLQAHGIQGDGI